MKGNSLRSLPLPVVMLTLLIVATAVSPASAIGILAPTETGLAPLSLIEQDVRVEITDQAARTKLTQVFHNGIDRPLEAHYLFPVPKGAQVTDFILYINGKPQHAEVLERDEARRIYEDIVSRMQDPGLLEYMDRDLFRVRVFPIPPNGDQKVELEYVQVLKMDNGAAEYRFPLAMKGQAATAKNQFEFSIASQTPLKSVYSPSHKLNLSTRSEAKMAGAIEITPDNAERDVTLVYSVSAKDIGLVVLPYRPNASRDGYFSILISPSIEAREADIQSKAITFVIDTSGSMAGEKIEQAKNALIYCLKSLRPRDHFNVIHFSTAVTRMENDLQPASPEAVRAAVRWVEDLRASGGTNIDGALQEALRATPPAKTVHTIVFLTDGMPTIGNTAPDEILANLQDSNREQLRVFTFGLGYDVNAKLLDDIADQTRSTSQYVRPDEDIEVSVSGFFDKVASPVLTNLKLQIDGIKTHDLFPNQMPDLFLGTQLVLFGRYSKPGTAAIRLEGDLAGEKHVFVHEAVFPSEADQHEYIEPLWAHRNVGYLLEEIRRHGEEKELVDEVIGLAKKYAIVTPYTSFLVTEDEQARPMAPFAGHAMEKPAISPPAPGSDLNFLRRNLQPAPQAAARLQRREARESAVMAESDSFATAAPSGAGAVEHSIQMQEFKSKSSLEAEGASGVVRASERTFTRKDEVWVDETIEKRETVLQVKFASAAYFEILKLRPDLKEALALGNQVEVRLSPTAILKIGAEGKGTLEESDRNMLK